jgi:hypothetical protein
MAINIDEGEPHFGIAIISNVTRIVLKARSSRPGQWVSRNDIYLRDEYHGCRAIRARERAQANQPRDPLIQMRRGVCAISAAKSPQ